MSLTDTRQSDLLSIIEREASISFTGPFHNFRDGEEYHSSCPFCKDGNNRFHVWPNAVLPHYWCRQCGAWGDALQFMVKFKGLFYSEACQELGIEPGQQYLHKHSGTPALSDDGPPSNTWQEMGETIACRAEKYLWTDAGKPAREYLHARGLRDDIIKTARLGYFPLDPQGSWYSRSFEDWGLDPDMLSEAQRAKGCVKVPDGLLIPWRADGQLWKLTVKRFQSKPNELKYGQILGSKECLYNSDAINPSTPALLCEKVTDWLSAEQEAGDLVVCVSVDGAGSTHTPCALARLSLALSLLIGFDVDENHAGEKGAQFWLAIFPHAARIVPWCKDINDMLKAGKDIRRWVSMGLTLVTERQIEPVPAVHLCRVCPEPGLFQDPVEPQVWWCEAHSDVARYIDPFSVPTTCCMCPAEIDQVDDAGCGYCQFHYEQVFLVPASFKDRPCAHCGGYEARRDEDGRWMCLCYWDASLRKPYSWQPGGTPVLKQKDWSSYW